MGAATGSRAVWGQGGRSSDGAAGRGKRGGGAVMGLGRPGVFRTGGRERDKASRRGTKGGPKGTAKSAAKCAENRFAAN